jgi:ADP-ribose pyrophosphatase YjhB (NUDIX family)
MKIGIDYTGVGVVFFCHDGKGNYLLSKRGKNCRDEHGRWDPGGGGLDFGDKVEEVLKKEIKEEYCADIINHKFLGYRDVHCLHEGVKTHWIILDFRVLIDPKQVKNGEPHKFEEIGWFRLDKLPEPLHLQFPAALKQYQGKL